MKPWKAVFFAMALVGFAPLVACEDQSNAAAPVDPLSRAIRDAEAGSDDALAKLEALSEENGLAEHADLIGAAATRISQEAAESDFPKGFVSRWHRLFFATDPLQNASAKTRKEFASSLFLIEPIMPDEVIPGREYNVGRRMVGTLRHDELEALDGYSVVESLKSVVANGKEHWPPGRGSIATRPLAFAKGGSSGSSFSTVLLDADHDPALEGPFELKIIVDVSMTEDSTDPPTVFAEWTEELTATPKVKRVFASSPIEPRPGEADIETVLALLAQFVELGERGELRPHADELGARLAQALRDDWQPRIAAHAREHGLISDDLGDPSRPKPDTTSALLIGLFFLADPVTTATPETWNEVARSGVYVGHEVTLKDVDDPYALLRTRVCTVLIQSGSLSQVRGIATHSKSVELGGKSISLSGYTSGRTDSATRLPPGRWQNYVEIAVPVFGSVDVLTADESAPFLEHQGQTIDDLRTHLELQLLHDDEPPLATWPVTIDTPITLEPLDETAPNRR